MTTRVIKCGFIVFSQYQGETRFVKWFPIQHGFIITTPVGGVTVTKHNNLARDRFYFEVSMCEQSNGNLSPYIFNNEAKLVNNSLFSSDTCAQIGDFQVSLTCIRDQSHVLMFSSLKQLVTYVDGILSSRTMIMI